MSDNPILTIDYGDVRLVPVNFVPVPQQKKWPVKIPNFLSAMFSFFTKLAVVMSMTALLALTWQEVFGRPVILEPIGVPERLQKMGLSRDVAAQRLWDAVVEINSKAETVKGHTSFVSQARQVEVTEPRTGLSIQSLADLMRALLNRPQKRVSGEFLCGDAECTIERVELRVRVFDGKRLGIARLGQIGQVDSDEDLDAYFQSAGMKVLRLVDPYVLSVFLNEEGKFDEAIGVSQGIITSNFGEKKWGHLSLGISRAKLERYEEAIASYERALELDPSFGIAYHNRGISFAMLGRHKEAIDSYKRALALEPKNVSTYFNLGISLSATSQYAEATKIYGQAIKLSPNFIDAHHNLGVSFARLGRHKEAIDSYKRALESLDGALGFETVIVSTYINLGASHAEIIQHEEAIRSYGQALERDSENVVAHFNLGISLAKLGRHKEAMDSYKRALALEPEYVRAHYNIGNLLARLGQNEDAIASYKHVLELDPDSFKALANWAILLGRVLAGASDKCAKLQELLPDFEAQVKARDDEYLLIQFDDILKNCDSTRD